MKITFDKHIIEKYKIEPLGYKYISQINSISEIHLFFRSTINKPIYFDNEVQIEIDDTQSDYYPINYVIENGLLIMSGYTCKKEEFEDIDSEDLSKSLVSAIQRLSNKKLINVPNISGEYKRLNESKISTLMKLLYSTGKPFVISHNSIIVIDIPEKIYELPKNIILSKIEFNNRLKEYKIKSSTIKQFTISNRGKYSNILSSKEVSENLVKMSKYRMDIPYIRITYEVPNELLNIPIGSKIKLDNKDYYLLEKELTNIHDTDKYTILKFGEII